jgi:hypothetical protein
MVIKSVTEFIVKSREERDVVFLDRWLRQTVISVLQGGSDGWQSGQLLHHSRMRFEKSTTHSPQGVRLEGNLVIYLLFRNGHIYKYMVGLKSYYDYSDIISDS